MPNLSTAPSIVSDLETPIQGIAPLLEKNSDPKQTKEFFSNTIRFSICEAIEGAFEEIKGKGPTVSLGLLAKKFDFDFTGNLNHPQAQKSFYRQFILMVNRRLTRDELDLPQLKFLLDTACINLPETHVDLMKLTSDFFIDEALLITGRRRAFGSVLRRS